MPEEEKTSIQPTTGAVMDVQAPKNANTESEPNAATQATESSQPSSEPKTGIPDSQPQETPLAVPLGGKTAHHSGKPVVAIIFAAVIALALAGLTVFAFQKSQTKASNPTTASKATPAAVVKASDVDQTSSGVDAILQKIDDTKDLTAADLTEPSLGL